MRRVLVALVTLAASLVLLTASPAASPAIDSVHSNPLTSSMHLMA